MKLFITGLNGFIARHLKAHLEAKGHSVGGTSRSGPLIWRLGDPVDPAWFQGVDVVLHAAHDFARGAMEANVKGTLALEEAASRAGVARQILLSSLSARPDAAAEYGRSKLAEEEHFRKRGHTIVRPGTVLGKGGLFGKMAGMVERWPILPLLDGGRGPMTVIGIGDLCRAFEEVLRRPAGGEFNLYYAERPTLGELLRLLRSILGRKCLFMPFPALLLLVPLTLLRWMRIPTPVDVDNLKGYLKSLEPHHATNLYAVLERPQSMEEALREAYGPPTR